MLILIIFALLCVALVACADAYGGAEVVRIQVESFEHTEYYQNKTQLNLEGARLRITYSDNTFGFLDLDHQGVSVSGFDNSVSGTNTITITYQKRSTTVDLTIIPLVLNYIGLGNVAEKRAVINETYITDENGEFLIDTTNVIFNGNYTIFTQKGVFPDFSGHRLLLFYNDGGAPAEVDIDAGMIFGISAGADSGKHAVELRHADFVCNFWVDVEDLTPARISVQMNERPTLNEYFVTQEFNPAGMVLTIIYNNESTSKIPYTAENAELFDFSNINFTEANNNWGVSVKYFGHGCGELEPAEFLVLVKIPQVVEFLLDYDCPETGARINGRPFSKEDQYKELGTNNTLTTPRVPVSALIRGLQIDWDSGSALVKYQYGAPEVVRLSNPSVRGYLNYGIEIVDTTEIGTTQLELYFGSASAVKALLSITVISETAQKIILGDTDSLVYSNPLLLEKRTYYEGDILDPFRSKFNVQFNNGECLFFLTTSEGVSFRRESALVSAWDYVDSSMVDSQALVVAYENGGNYALQISYSGIVSTQVELKVERLFATKIDFEEPSKNRYLAGRTASDIDLTHAVIGVSFNSGAFAVLSTNDPRLSLSIWQGGSEVSAFSTAGESYKVRINFLSLYVEYEVTATDLEVDKLTLLNVPTDFRFTTVQCFIDSLSGLNFEVVYSNFTVEITQVTEADIFRFNGTKTGVQDILLRFGGAVVVYTVNITGRFETALTLIRAPHKTAYTVLPESSFGISDIDLDGIVISRAFNDGSHSQVHNFAIGNWEFSLIDSLLENVKTYVIRLTNQFYSYEISFDILLISAEVTRIEFDSDQLDGGKLSVAPKADINLLGLNLVLTVFYKESAGGAELSQDIPLLRAYIWFDPNSDTAESEREVNIRYAGFIAKITIFVNQARILDRIEIHETPDFLHYPELLNPSFKGGVIKRIYANGDIDYLPMSDASVTLSVYNPYILNAPHLLNSEAQTITVTHGGKTANFEMFTHKKFAIDSDFALYAELTNMQSIYGDFGIPEFSFKSIYANFKFPEAVIEFLDTDGAWKVINITNGVFPILPASYDLLVRIIGNDYYESVVIESATLVQKFIVLPRPITVVAHDKNQIYNMASVDLTWYIEGGDSEIITVNGVKDAISFRIFREDNTNLNVKYVEESDGSITVLGYAIGFELSEGNNQNSRYDISFESGNYYITRRKVARELRFYTINFELTNGNVVADGSPKTVTASYADTFATLNISAQDMAYYALASENNWVKLSEPPRTVGTYRVSLSPNYEINLTDGGAEFYQFNIVSG